MDLDDSLTMLGDYPDHIIRNEEWDIMSESEKMANIGNNEPSIFCEEKNIRELLEKHSIKIPNIEFVTFYEYLKDKLDPNISKEWEDIRDRYICNMKKFLSGPYLSNNYSKAKKILQNSEKFIESKNYHASIIHTYLVIETVLNTLSKSPKLSMLKKIETLRSYPPLQNHIINLHHVCDVRDAVVCGDLYEPSEDDAKECFKKVNRFLVSIRDIMHN